jgi:hypothetical protein
MFIINQEIGLPEAGITYSSFLYSKNLHSQNTNIKNHLLYLQSINSCKDRYQE